jgi:Domain of unknown function (DUF4388)
VSLEGTLETIALPDVLALLSVTAKTGELRVESGGEVGRVWLDAGRVAGFDVGRQRTAVDALFAMLRFGDGSFKFHAGTEPQNLVEPQEVARLMEEVEERLQQWPAISAVVPSLSARLNLETSVDREVTLSPEQWGLVAQIGGGRTVGEVLDARGLGEFDGCKAVKELVDTGLVHVDHFEASAGPLALSPGPPSEEFAPAAQDYVAMAPGSPDFPDFPDFPGGGATSNGWSDAELTSLSEVWNGETGTIERGTIERGRVETGPIRAEGVRFGEGRIGEGGIGEGPVADGTVEAGLPVNRGLLLKFLGSARS